MKQASTFSITTTHILVPLSIVSFTLMLFFGFQMFQVMAERKSLRDMDTRIAQSYEESQRLNQQFSGLVLGTQKLANEGVESARALESRLIEVGVLPPRMDPALQAPVPAAADTSAEKGPVKP